MRQNPVSKVQTEQACDPVGLVGWGSALRCWERKLKRRIELMVKEFLLH